MTPEAPNIKTLWIKYGDLCRCCCCCCCCYLQYSEEKSICVMEVNGGKENRRFWSNGSLFLDTYTK